VSTIPMDIETCQRCKLRKPGWFCDLSPHAMAEYDALGANLMLPEGGILFAEGQLPRSVSVICEGRVKLTKSSRGGKTLLVKIATAGDVLGLSAALSRTSYEVTAQAMGRTSVRIFPQQAFLSFIQRHAEGSFRAAESLSNEYRSLLSDAYRLALSKSIAGRVAHLLLQLVVEGDDPLHAQPGIHMALRHEELAAMLGSSRETVTRVLGDFKRKGIIATQGTRMTVLRKEALEQLL